MTRGPMIYGRGAGWVTHFSGSRLGRAACEASLARHRAIATDPNATAREQAQARHAHEQLSAAMAASFEPQEATP